MPERSQVQYFTKDEAKELSKRIGALDADSDTKPETFLTSLNRLLGIVDASYSKQPHLRFDPNKSSKELETLLKSLEAIHSQLESLSPLASKWMLASGLRELGEYKEFTWMMIASTRKATSYSYNEDQKKGRTKRHFIDFIPRLIPIYKQATGKDPSVNNWEKADPGPFVDLVRAFEKKLGINRVLSTTVKACKDATSASAREGD